MWRERRKGTRWDWEWEKLTVSLELALLHFCLQKESLSLDLVTPHTYYREPPACFIMVISNNFLKWKDLWFLWEDNKRGRIWFCIFPAVRFGAIDMLESSFSGAWDHMYLLKLSWILMKYICKNLTCARFLWNVSSFLICAIFTPWLLSSPCQFITQLDYVSSSKSFLREARVSEQSERTYGQWLSHSETYNKFKVLRNQMEKTIPTPLLQRGPSQQRASAHRSVCVFGVYIMLDVENVHCPECLRPYLLIFLLAKMFILITLFLSHKEVQV